MGETKKVLTELKNGVLIVTINREERRNAIDPETSAMMEQILNDAEQNPEVGAIIITGTGDRSFCSGEDLAAYDENGTILRYPCTNQLLSRICVQFYYKCYFQKNL